MARRRTDHALEMLLDLNGQVFFIDDRGDYWVRFLVKVVSATPERPHGLRYSLSLHDRAGRRLVGFDNAHAVAERSRGTVARRDRRFDHRHRLGSVRPYDYTDPTSLLADFWRDVDLLLKERGVR